MDRKRLRAAAALTALAALAALALGFSSTTRVESIDTALFAHVPGDTPRTVEASTIIAAPPEAVFDQIATMDGVRRWLGIGSTIELSVGGAYEWYFDPRASFGSRGTEGSQVLGFAPGRMLCVAWNVPPTLKRVRGERTWVTFLVEPVRGGTRLTVIHAGFGDSPGWNEAFRYYENGWPQVVAQLRRSLTEPSD